MLELQECWAEQQMFCGVINISSDIWRSLICTLWLRERQREMPLCRLFLCPVRLCQVISRKGSKLRLNLPVSVQTSFSSWKQMNVSPSGDLFYWILSIKKCKQLVNLTPWLRDNGNYWYYNCFNTELRAKLFVFIWELSWLVMTSHWLQILWTCF